MKRNIKFLLITITTILFISCGNILSGEKIDEGKIVYKIEYLDDENDNPLISLLPKEMTIMFKDDNTVSRINGFFGTFKQIFEISFRLFGKIPFYMCRESGAASSSYT